MGDIVARLLPSVRDIRNPLALGSVWLVTIWAIAQGRGAQSSSLGEFFEEMLSGVPGVTLVAAFAFAATLIGSGLLRLMNRLMQLQQAHRHDLRYNPLDEPEPFEPDPTRLLKRLVALPWFLVRAIKQLFSKPADTSTGLSHSDGDTAHCLTSDIESSPLLEEHIKALYREDPARLERWRVGVDGEVVEYEARIFRRFLGTELEFAALASEHLLRFALVPPVFLAGSASLVWTIKGGGASTLWLCVGFLLIVLILIADYQRTGSLLRKRWLQLVDDYPDWLPEEGEKLRERYDRRAQATLDFFWMKNDMWMINRGAHDAIDISCTFDGDDLPDFGLSRLAPSESVFLTSLGPKSSRSRIRGNKKWTDGRGVHSASLSG